MYWDKVHDSTPTQTVTVVSDGRANRLLKSLSLLAERLKPDANPDGSPSSASHAPRSSAPAYAHPHCKRRDTKRFKLGPR
ncbi:hypothetical protein CEXT_197251 [Caerostris extrusa]|uniref:Uncharacterized protein n=1 Tax=Caerostris extrusa TaxID=172846 RepID=A0AAV4MDG9_CAEEX|nr:hypothetical protein CEXT_197251 [Caerostris extrusa]